MRTVAAFGVVLASMAWLVLSTDDQQTRALHLFHTFVPLTLALGAGGLWLAVSASWREGWNDRIEGLATLSLLSLAWGHDGARAAVRRAAQAAGYEEAAIAAASSYRIASGLALAFCALLVVRWLTRRQSGEWCWAAIAVGWAAVVVLGHQYLQAALVWVYVRFGI